MMANMRSRGRAIEAQRISKLVGSKERSIGLQRRSEAVQRYVNAYGLDLVDVAKGQPTHRYYYCHNARCPEKPRIMIPVMAANLTADHG